MQSILPLTGTEKIFPFSSGWVAERPEFSATYVSGTIFEGATIMAQVDCSVAFDSCRDKELAARLKVAAVAFIFVASSLGVLIPLAGKRFKLLHPDGDCFFVTKAFAAGVILATAFVHMLPDAMETLSNPCLPDYPWTKFPFAGFIAMCAALVTLIIDFAGTQYYEKNQLRREERLRGEVKESSILDLEKALAAGEDGSGHVHIVTVHSEPAHGHAHGPISSPDETEEKLARVRQVVISQVLELGIVAHSVIIGVTLGVSDSPCTIRPLIAALCFHQFFEGFALGGCISQAGFKDWSAGMMAFFFTVTTPLGIGIGMGIQNGYNGSSPKALVVQGTFDSISAGILTYMALVDLIAADLLSKRLRGNLPLQFMSYLALFCGAGAMSLLAVWA